MLSIANAHPLVNLGCDAHTFDHLQLWILNPKTSFEPSPRISQITT